MDAGAGPATEAVPVEVKRRAWPKDAVAQVRAVADTLAHSPVPLSTEDITKRFAAKGPWKKRVPQLLEMLVVLGRARESDGRYQALP
jgi:hypothetical protein